MHNFQACGGMGISMILLVVKIRTGYVILMKNVQLYQLYYFKELNHMVSAETLLFYPDWKIPLTYHTDAYNKQLGAVISQNNKLIKLFSIRLIDPHHNYNMTNKELLAIVECLKKSRGIIFGYEINVFQIIKIWSMPPT